MIDPQLELSSRGCLPSTFMHGYSSASYQIEGGYKQDGRGLSAWDTSLRDAPLGNGDVACDSYNLWRDDIQLLKEYGANTYRFSISWSRVIPLGGRHDPVNLKGLEYYSNLIDGLIAAGITPFVTLFHWDTPLALEQRYRGFSAPEHEKEELMLDFERYVDLMFETLGDRVKHWITHNEPQSYAILNARVLKKGHFDVETERWILGNNLILTHARAVDLYRRNYQREQGGVIGITLDMEWVEPLRDSPEARKAATESVDILAAWFADPIFLGKHNDTITTFSNGNLPHFTKDEWAIIHGSYDFFGVNHYSTKWATGAIRRGLTPDERYHGDYEHVTNDLDGKPIGERGHNGHPYNVPWGFRKLLRDIKRRWLTAIPVPIYVTENGFAGDHEGDRCLSDIVDDRDRQDYFRGYLEAMRLAIVEDKINVAGYFGWSLLDNLEWNMGYAPRFGVTHVDRENGCKRTPKDSTKLVKAIFDHIVAEEPEDD